MDRRTVYVAVTVVGVVAFLAVHAAMTATRGCDTVGGEHLLLLAPLWTWVLEMTIMDWR